MPIPGESVEKLKARGSSEAANLIFCNSKSVLRDGHISAAQRSRRGMLSVFLQNIAIQGLQKTNKTENNRIQLSHFFICGAVLTSSPWSSNGPPCQCFKYFPDGSFSLPHNRLRTLRLTQLPIQTAFFMLIGIIVELLKEFWSQSKAALHGFFFTDKSIPECAATSAVKEFINVD